MKVYSFVFTISALVCFMGFSCKTSTDRTDYKGLYDPIKDVGQYRLPALGKTPQYCFDLKISQSDKQVALKEYLLGSSISGLTARALKEGKTNTGIWIVNDRDNGVAYQAERESLKKKKLSFL